MTVVIEYIHRDTNGAFWIDIKTDGAIVRSIGPFSSAAERQMAQDDFLEIATGAADPAFRQ